MIAWTDVGAFLVLGLAGSLHCAGMCGGFAVAVAAGRGGGAVLARRQGAYVLGKATTYAVLGLALASGSGWLVAATTSSEAGFLRVQAALAWAAGLLLVLTGLHQLGWRPRFAGRLALPSAVVAGTSRLFAAVRSLPGASGAFGTGILNGLLPCGLSWAAFVLAARSSPPTAALGAFLFGLATGPVLVAVGLGSRAASGRLRRRAPLVLGSVLVVLGAATVARSLPRTAAAGAPGAPAPCCSPSEAGGTASAAGGAHAETGPETESAR